MSRPTKPSSPGIVILPASMVAKMRKQRAVAKPKAAPVGPTPERLAKGDLVEGEHRIGRGEVFQGARVEAATPLDRYRKAGHVSEAQFRAGVRLRRDWQSGDSGRRLVALYGERTTAPSGEVSDEQADHRHAYAIAMHELGPELAPVIVHVVLQGESAPSWAEARGRRGVRAKEHGMSILCLALDRLARHYQLTGRGTSE